MSEPLTDEELKEEETYALEQRGDLMTYERTLRLIDEVRRLRGLLRPRYQILVMLRNEHVYFSRSTQEEAFAYAEALEKAGGVIRCVYAQLYRDLTDKYREKRADTNP